MKYQREKISNILEVEELVIKSNGEEKKLEKEENITDNDNVTPICFFSICSCWVNLIN